MANITESGIEPIIDCLRGRLKEVPRISKINRCGLTYNNKVALITGAAKGIGEGCAKVFVDAGAKVMICDIDIEGGTRVAKELTGKGPGECVFMKCDVSKPEEIKALIDETVARFGSLDCLFNNAGCFPGQKPIDDWTLQDLMHVVNTNFISQFMACKYALPHLRKTRGSIINMGSVASFLGHEGSTLYSASKGAISSFTKSLAIEEARHGVRVNAVLPGNIYTDSRAQGIKALGEKGPEIDRWADSLQIMGRSGIPEEVGQVVLFLASEAASFLTGIEVIISGGIELGVGVKYPPLYT